MPYKKKTKLNKNFVAIIFAIFTFISISPVLESSLLYNAVIGPEIIGPSEATITIGDSTMYKSTTRSLKLYGDGSLNKPFEVYTLKDLYLIEYNINNLNLTSFVKGHYTLMNNINCQGYSFQPIGCKNAFEGVFNGNGYSISNFSIYYNGTVSNNSLYLGIFGQNKGTVKNLTVDSNMSINLTDRYSANVYIGGICGQNDGTIESCTKNSYLEVYTVGSENNIVTVNMGGICGKTTKELKNCINNGDISGKKTTVSGKYSTGVTYSIGGITGNSSANFTCCYNHGNISCEVVKDSYLGGIVGHAPSTIRISYCYSTNSISSNASNNCCLGGIVGYAEEGLLVSISYNSGNITIKSSPNECYVGGIVGRSNSGSINLESVYNNSTVNSGQSTTRAYAGGLIGYCNSANTNACYVAGTVAGKGTTYNTDTEERYYNDAIINSRDIIYQYTIKKLTDLTYHYFIGNYTKYTANNYTFTKTYYSHNITFSFTNAIITCSCTKGKSTGNKYTITIKNNSNISSSPTSTNISSKALYKNSLIPNAYSVYRDINIYQYLYLGYILDTEVTYISMAFFNYDNKRDEYNLQLPKGDIETMPSIQYKYNVPLLEESTNYSANTYRKVISSLKVNDLGNNFTYINGQNPILKGFNW